MLKLSRQRVKLVPRVSFNRDRGAFIDFVSQVSLETQPSEISTSSDFSVVVFPKQSSTEAQSTQRSHREEHVRRLFVQGPSSFQLPTGIR